MELKNLSAQDDKDIDNLEENDTKYLRQNTLATSAMREKKKKLLVGRFKKVASSNSLT
jgi:hypothetical protein